MKDPNTQFKTRFYQFIQVALGIIIAPIMATLIFIPVNNHNVSKVLADKLPEFKQFGRDIQEVHSKTKDIVDLKIMKDHGYDTPMSGERFGGSSIFYFTKLSLENFDNNKDVPPDFTFVYKFSFGPDSYCTYKYNSEDQQFYSIDTHDPVCKDKDPLRIRVKNMWTNDLFMQIGFIILGLILVPKPMKLSFSMTFAITLVNLFT